MLTKTEFKQIITSLTSMSYQSINGHAVIDLKNTLKLISEYSDGNPEIKYELCDDKTEKVSWEFTNE